MRTIVVCGGDNDILSNLPIIISALDVIESDLSCLSISRRFQIGPDVGPGLSVHFKRTEAHCEYFIAVSGKIWRLFVTVHSDGELRVVGVLLCADFHVSTLHHNVTCIESLVIAMIIIIGLKDKGAVDEDKF